MELNYTLRDKSDIVLLDIYPKTQSNDANELTYMENLRFRIAKQINTYLSHGSFANCYQHFIIIFLTKDSSINRKDLAAEIRQHISNIYPSLYIQLGVSSNQTDHLFKAYEEALLALKRGKEKNIDIQLFDDIGFHKIFTNFHSKYYIQQFCHSTLKPLYVLEKDKQAELIKTLEVFLDQNLSFKETAATLFVHPNTIRYRIQNIKEMYEDEDMFADPDKRLDLSLAIKLSSSMMD